MPNGLFGPSGTLNSRATKSSWALNQAFYYKATHATSSRSLTVPRQVYGSFVFYLPLLYTIAFTAGTFRSSRAANESQHMLRFPARGS